MNGFGLYRVQQKTGLSNTRLAALSKADVPGIDRFSAGWYSETAQTTSDFLCYGTLVVAPGLLALNPAVQSRYGQVAALYIKTLLATATFFAAKVFHDFNPSSRAAPYVWGSTAVVPMAVAYYRIETGKHFLSDNLVGYAVGAAMGVLVPQLHKKAGHSGMLLLPMQGLNVNGYAYSGVLLSKRL